MAVVEDLCRDRAGVVGGGKLAADAGTMEAKGGCELKLQDQDLSVLSSCF